jgi:diguanylate cyclase (GGDEF)-like protein
MSVSGHRPEARSRYRLLLVDDEPENLDALARVFRKEFETATAASGAGAVELLEQARAEQRPFDLLLTDQRMPGLRGTELCTRARELSPEMIRIIITGHIDVDDLLDAINRGEVYRFVTKPWDPAELRLVVRRALETYQLTRDNARLLAEVVSRNAELAGTEQELTRVRAELEQRVSQRSAELDAANAKLESAIRELQLLATTDPLTGLPNRRGFHSAAARELRRAGHLGLPVSLILFDVDDLGEYNDRYRHTAGDELLTRIASTLREHTREVDLVARHGGDEFIVLLVESDREAALGAARRVLVEVAETLGVPDAVSRPAPGSPAGAADAAAPRVTLSVGVVTFPENGADLGSLVQQAELALVRAKSEGGNRVVAAAG